MFISHPATPAKPARRAPPPRTNRPAFGSAHRAARLRHMPRRMRPGARHGQARLDAAPAARSGGRWAVGGRLVLGAARGSERLVRTGQGWRRVSWAKPLNIILGLLLLDTRVDMLRA